MVRNGDGGLVRLEVELALRAEHDALEFFPIDVFLLHQHVRDRV